jgi:ribulose-phosphate 3-epimerase
MKKCLSVSILSADFGHLADQIQRVTSAGADWIHVDVMDGHFVPNITMGPPLVRSIRKITKLPLDVHLMIENPDRYLEAFVEAGADRIGVHPEACVHLHRTLQRIRELGASPTVTLNPATPLQAIRYVLGRVDMALLMTVNPGFSGQTFLPEVLPKIRELRKSIDASGLPVLIEVDGGIHLDTIDDALAAGADAFVSGSGVFSEDRIEDNVRALKRKMMPEGCKQAR